MSPSRETPARATGVQVIGRAAEILRTLHDVPEGMTLSQLAQAAGLARTTVHRIVQALQTEGLVTTPDGRGAVRLGPELGRLAAGTSAAIAWSIRPFLEALAQEVNETIDLATLYGTRVRFIDQVVPGRRLRATSIFGEQFPANTITTRLELLAELERVRDAGVAFDREETELGICAVAAVVANGLGPQAAVTIAAPTDRFHEAQDAFADAVRATARDATASLLRVS
jgi:DNA-binding IclR family transcriptional regulator